MGKNTQYDLRDLCEGLMLGSGSLLSGLTANEYLLVLFDILSTINTLACSLGPLTAAVWMTRQKISKLYNQEATTTGSELTGDTNPLSASDPAINIFNPYVPLTADREFKLLSDNLGQALITWESSFKASDPLQNAAAQGERGALLPLLHFARLLLAAGPCIYTLPSLVAYTSEPRLSLPPKLPRPCAPHTIGIHFDDHAIRHSIEILEAVEAHRNASDDSKRPSEAQHRLSPMWYPLALFYGALVIWAKMEVDAERSHSKHSLLSPRRLLQNFCTELKIVGEDWECSKQMSEVVARLIT